MITDERVYFQPSHPSLFDVEVLSIQIGNLLQMLKRRYMHQDCGLELVSRLQSMDDMELLEFDLHPFSPSQHHETLYIVFPE